MVGAAALEKVMLVDISRRGALDEGFTQELGTELATLERRTAGQLLARLKQLGVDEPIATRVGEFIARRNEVVHDFMERPDVITAFVTGDVADLVADLEDIAIACQQIVNEIAPPAFGAVEQLLGVSLESLVEHIRTIDLDTVVDEGLRRQIELAQMLTPERLAELRIGDVDPAEP